MIYQVLSQTSLKESKSWLTDNVAFLVFDWSASTTSPPGVVRHHLSLYLGIVSLLLFFLSSFTLLSFFDLHIHGRKDISKVFFYPRGNTDSATVWYLTVNISALSLTWVIEIVWFPPVTACCSNHYHGRQCAAPSTPLPKQSCLKTSNSLLKTHTAQNTNWKLT